MTSIQGLQFEHAVTAVAFAPFPHDNGYMKYSLGSNDSNEDSCISRYLLSIGLENGQLWIYSCNELDGRIVCRVLTEIDETHFHTAAVKRIAWRPRTDEICLATCSLDHCVKIFGLTL